MPHKTLLSAKIQFSATTGTNFFLDLLERADENQDLESREYGVTEVVDIVSTMVTYPLFSKVSIVGYGVVENSMSFESEASLKEYISDMEGASRHYQVSIIIMPS